MSVQIRLDKGNNVFTNLDNITGNIILNLFREEALTAIVVKLECESRTRLAAPRIDSRRDHDAELEVHKLLYRTSVVFPSVQLLNAAPRGASFTLSPGRHEYPFQFKIPFNNACIPANSMIDRMGIAQDYNKHVKRPLPPSLTGFPGEAEIRYFVKTTVQRAAFYKENFRNEVNFKFFPIEPIRPLPNRRESYARRQHQFAPPVVMSRKPGLFANNPGIAASGPPPRISVDGRLPDPAILTCNNAIPLRVLIKKLNETSEIIFLQTFQIVLIGFTKIRAHELERIEKSSWVIVSMANLQVPLGTTSTPIDKDVEIDVEMWSRVPLPNTVPPSFETCNLSRYYELDISVGLVYGTKGNMKPELTIQSLRMPVQIYSGIEPPNALVHEIARRQGNPQQQAAPNASTFQSGSESLSSHEPGQAFSHGAITTQPSNHSLGAIPDEPPPSYEDAMAEDLAPVDGPRREYEQPESGPVAAKPEKGGGLFGHNENLFS